jgi:hypothetical protein
MPDFTKAEFEACLTELGEIPHGPFDEVIKDVDSKRWVALSDVAALVGGVVLFGTRLFDDDETSLTVKDRLARATKGPDLEIVEDELLAKADPSVILCPNHYCLVTYFPKGDKGRGEAAYYALPYFNQAFEGASSTITPTRAVEPITKDAVEIGDSGLFALRSDAENARSAVAPFQRTESLESYVNERQPGIVLEVDTTKPEGNFEALEPDRNYFSGSHRYLNKFNYSGNAQAVFDSSSLAMYRVVDGQLQKLVGINATNMAFSDEHPLAVEFGWTTEQIGSRTELAQAYIIGDGAISSRTAQKLYKRITVEEAIATSILSPEDCSFEVVDPLNLLFCALSSDTHTDHVHLLSESVRPKVDVSSFLAEVQRTAQNQWRNVLFGEKKLEPRVVGLGAVAHKTGFIEEDSDQLIPTNVASNLLEI